MKCSKFHDVSPESFILNNHPLSRHYDSIRNNLVGRLLIRVRWKTVVVIGRPTVWLFLHSSSLINTAGAHCKVDYRTGKTVAAATCTVSCGWRRQVAVTVKTIQGLPEGYTEAVWYHISAGNASKWQNRLAIHVQISNTRFRSATCPRVGLLARSVSHSWWWDPSRRRLSIRYFRMHKRNLMCSDRSATNDDRQLVEYVLGPLRGEHEWSGCVEDWL